MSCRVLVMIFSKFQSELIQAFTVYFSFALFSYRSQLLVKMHHELDSREHILRWWTKNPMNSAVSALRSVPCQTALLPTNVEKRENKCLFNKSQVENDFWLRLRAKPKSNGLANQRSKQVHLKLPDLGLIHLHHSLVKHVCVCIIPNARHGEIYRFRFFSRDYRICVRLNLLTTGHESSNVRCAKMDGGNNPS